MPTDCNLREVPGFTSETLPAYEAANGGAIVETAEKWSKAQQEGHRY